MSTYYSCKVESLCRNVNVTTDGLLGPSEIKRCRNFDLIYASYVYFSGSFSEKVKWVYSFVMAFRVRMLCFVHGPSQGLHASIRMTTSSVYPLLEQ